MRFNKIWFIVVICMINNLFSMENTRKVMVLNEHQTTSHHINNLIKKNLQTCIFLRDHPNSYYSCEGYGLIYLGKLADILRGTAKNMKSENNERHFEFHTYDYYGQSYEFEHKNCLTKLHTSLEQETHVSCSLSQGEEAIIILNPHLKYGYPEKSPALCNEIEKLYSKERRS